MSSAQVPEESTLEYEHGVPILTVRGDIDIWNIEDFHRPLQQLVESATHGAIVELNDVTFAIGRVFGTLTAAAEKLTRENKRLVVVCPSNHFGCRIFSILHYPHTIAESREEALDALHK
ncbi:MAG: STAS domain-containing protein [Candidatus Eremiobacteraeota bacterium]|nr:STAS domain-containing protein [Candidatus Eremiobacteraeota bacterium]